ncbi:MAG TPA: hypothetical protein PLU43_05295, partial [Lachnospiraceae bacterium]|nr:hypothetical protein [Lachnospiraceae bacterium]
FEKVPYINREGNAGIRLVFLPMQSYLFCFMKKEQPTGYKKEPIQIQNVEMKKEWNVKEPFCNALTLDYCDFRINEEEWNLHTAVIKVQDALLARREPCKVTLRFLFEAELDLYKNKECCLVLEDAKKYALCVNGYDISTKETGWWKDQAFRTVSIKPYLKNGSNEILLSVQFEQPQKVYDVLFGEQVYETEKNKLTYGIEIENIYLIGDFGVYSRSSFVKAERNALLTKGPFVIRDMPEQFTGLALTEQGCLFLADKIVLSQQIRVKKEPDKRQMLTFGGQKAPLMKLYVNQAFVKNFMWEPYEADITDELSDGDNEIVLELFASNRNLLGPHHHIDGECYHVGPESFTGKWSWVERETEADATDISDRNKNYWTDTYSFIEFGMEQIWTD